MWVTVSFTARFKPHRGLVSLQVILNFFFLFSFLKNGSVGRWETKRFLGWPHWTIKCAHILFLWVFLSHSIKVGIAELIFTCLTRTSAVNPKSRYYVTLAMLRMSWLCTSQIEALTSPPPHWAPPPPGHLNFWKSFVQIPPSPGQKAVQMPPPSGELPDYCFNFSVASIMLLKLCM